MLKAPDSRHGCSLEVLTSRWPGPTSHQHHLLISKGFSTRLLLRPLCERWDSVNLILFLWACCNASGTHYARRVFVGWFLHFSLVIASLCGSEIMPLWERGKRTKKNIFDDIEIWIFSFSRQRASFLSEALVSAERLQPIRAAGEMCKINSIHLPMQNRCNDDTSLHINALLKMWLMHSGCECVNTSREVF